jgi:HK97 family phage major capsid protein
MKRDFKQEALELRKQRAKIVDEMNDLTEPTKWTAEGQKRYKVLDEQQGLMKAQIDALERQAGLGVEMGNVTDPPSGQLITDPANGGQRTLTAVTRAEDRPLFRSEEFRRYYELRDSQEYRRAFWDYQCSRRSDVRPPAILDECLALESRAYTGLGDSTSGTDGYYLVPIGFQRELEKRLISFGGMRRNARVLNTSTGNILNWPTADDTANIGNWVAESNPVTQANPSFSNVQFNAYLASSQQVLVSVQLLQDSAFDLEAYLSEAFAIRLARITNPGYTSGNGTSQPQGILTAIEADSSPNVITAVGDASNSGASDDGSNSIGTDDLANLIGSIDPLYRVGAMFMAHWSTYDYLRKLKDKYGRPLWEVSIAQGVPDKIYGYPYDWNADMQAWTQGASESGVMASKYTMLFGNFSRYIVREIGGITMVRFNELYMPNHQVGFQAFLRTDGRRIQQYAFGLLQQAAS